jgi:hypothetical protein
LESEIDEEIDVIKDVARDAETGLEKLYRTIAAKSYKKKTKARGVEGLDATAL